MKTCDKCKSPAMREAGTGNQTLPVRTYLLQLGPQYCPEDGGEELTDAAMSMDLCNLCAQNLVKAANAFLNAEGIRKELVLRKGRQAR